MKDIGGSRRSRYGSFIVDERGTILGFDEAMEALTGWSASQLVGRRKDVGLSMETDATVSTQPLYEGEIPPLSRPNHRHLMMHCADGRELDVEVLVRPLDGPGDRVLVTALGVLARSGAESSASKLHRHDALTGLLDAKAFMLQLTEDFDRAAIDARPLSVILLDVDHLREINDLEGHDVGDDVLRKIAGVLRVTVDDEARIARLSEDDFGVILPQSGRGDARQMAASLRSTVERFQFFGNDSNKRRPQVTITLGASSFPADADSERELIERAQEALAEARSMGRNRVWCYLRRPRVPVQVPVYFDSADPILVGYSRDISPSGIFVQTTAGIDVGMRCAFAFGLPGQDGRVHVVGRVVRTVRPDISDEAQNPRIPGLGVEFERFGGNTDRHALDTFLHGREETTLRPETGPLSL